MSHTDYIEKAPESFEITAKSETCPVCAMKNAEKENLRSTVPSRS